MNDRESSDLRFLAAILEGEIDARSAPAARRLAADPALAKRLAEMRAAVRGLDAMGAEAHGVMSPNDEAPPADTLPGADRIDPTLRRLTEAPTGPESMPRAAWLVAAALLLSISAVFALRSGDRAAPLPISLGREVPLTAPVGQTDEFDLFAWEFPLPEGSGCYFVVRLFSADDQATPILESPPLERASWRPTAAQRARLPDAIRWEVHVLDAIDRSRAFGSARAERRSR